MSNPLIASRLEGNLWTNKFPMTDVEAIQVPTPKKVIGALLNIADMLHAIPREKK